METELEKKLSELRQLGDHCTYNEEQAKQSIILPILSSLGWQVFNRAHIVAEFCIDPKEKEENRQWVDYCLKIANWNAVFIEAKRPGENLERHAFQLLNYAFLHGVSLAVLTTGLEWWMYLPLKRGTWNERRFANIDVRNDVDAAHRLEAFLGREAVATGTALGAAQNAIVETALPQAWSELCGGLRDTLFEGLVKKLRDFTGYDPDRQLVEQFIHNRSHAIGRQGPRIIEEPTSVSPADAGPEGRISVATSALAIGTTVRPWDLDHFRMKPETRELYDRVDKAIAELDSRIQPAKINKEFIGYRTTGNYFCTVKPTAKALNIQVKCKGGSPQPSGLEVMELPRDRWGPMTHTFKISEKRQVEPALQVISLALKDSV